MPLLSYLSVYNTTTKQTNVRVCFNQGGAVSMKVQLKKLLRFYFSADKLNTALDGIILQIAVKSGSDLYSGGERYFERISKILSVKTSLEELWGRLDSVIANMTERDRVTLSVYAAARAGTARLKEGERREMHRALTKFSRRAEGIVSACGNVYPLICEYYCFLYAR